MNECSLLLLLNEGRVIHLFGRVLSDLLYVPGSVNEHHKDWVPRSCSSYPRGEIDKIKKGIIFFSQQIDCSKRVKKGRIVK